MDDGVIHTVRADQKMARECYAAGLKVKPRMSEPLHKKSEVAMMELDPITHLEERVEPMGEVCSFIIREKEGQSTTLGRNLTKDQADMIATDMPGIHPDVISHRLSLFKDAQPVV